MTRGVATLFLLAPFFAGCLSFHQGALPGAPASARYADVDGVHVRFIDTGEPGEANANAKAEAKADADANADAGADARAG